MRDSISISSPNGYIINPSPDNNDQELADFFADYQILVEDLNGNVEVNFSDFDFSITAPSVYITPLVLSSLVLDENIPSNINNTNGVDGYYLQLFDANYAKYLPNLTSKTKLAIMDEAYQIASQNGTKQATYKDVLDEVPNVLERYDDNQEDDDYGNVTYNSVFKKFEFELSDSLKGKTKKHGTIGDSEVILHHNGHVSVNGRQIAGNSASLSLEKEETLDKAFGFGSVDDIHKYLSQKDNIVSQSDVRNFLNSSLDTLGINRLTSTDFQIKVLRPLGLGQKKNFTKQELKMILERAEKQSAISQGKNVFSVV